MERLGINEYYMNIAVQVSLRSTCTRRRVGAVIVKDNRILSTGYNGSPSGMINCTDCKDRCYRSLNNIPSGEDLHLCYAIHAEQNAIMNALRTGEKLDGASIYITTFPCSTCAKLILQSGIRYIYYIDTYKDDFTKDMLEEVGAKLTNLDGSIYQTPKGSDVKTVNDLDTIDPLVEAIYKYKPGTPEFISNRHDIFIKNNLYDKYNEMVFYTKSKLRLEILKYNKGILASLGLSIGNRNNLEYNGDDKKQLVVASIVYDRATDSYYLLKSLNGRLKDKFTMIQGHVGVPEEIFQISNMFNDDEILLYNLKKELREEVNLRFFHNIIPRYIISTNDNKISSEHMGVLYIVEIDSSYMDISNLKSGEPEKHELVKMSRKEFFSEENRNKMDTWLRKFIDKLEDEIK